MIIQYVRNEKNNPIGTVVSTGKNEIGISSCNPKDKFVKTLGVEIAAGRAIHNKPWTTYVINDNKDVFGLVVEKVRERSRKYYK